MWAQKLIKAKYGRADMRSSSQRVHWIRCELRVRGDSAPGLTVLHKAQHQRRFSQSSTGILTLIQFLSPPVVSANYFLIELDSHLCRLFLQIRMEMTHSNHFAVILLLTA